MGRADRVDDMSFRLNFAGDGAAKLRQRVREKLKEFMGDYTDDTLVEYVIVLLKNGRRKEEAKNELNVFLGDDSDSFVSWLWDHLGSNLDLYVETAESSPTNKRPVPEDETVKNDYKKLDSEAEGGKNNLPKNRHNREWKGLVRSANESPILRSVVTTNVHTEEGTHHKVGHAKKTSPQPVIHRKRSRSDEQTDIKREAVPKATIDASRRLLQFAVRDAVTPSSKPSALAPEPSLKRLRSVVSTSTVNSSIIDRTERIHSTVRVPNPSPITAKPVDETSKNVVKVRSSRNVFDRLGRAIDLEEEEASREDVGEYEKYLQQSKYGAINAIGRRVLDVSQVGPSGKNRVNDPMMLQRSVADNTELIERKKQQLVTVANHPSKMVNISMNVNTRYQDPQNVSNMNSRKFDHENKAGAKKSGEPPTKENNNLVTVGNGNAIPVADDQQEYQNTVSSTPGLYPTGRPTEDADSRTIFVSNVHFAATKDSLSRHFNKFGDVLKVVILTDLATGQPKGSAYVEFMRKEAAEHALSLNGTSFMSRILKVVKKSSAPQEAISATPWPHVTRGSPFVGSTFSRAPFPRGIPSIYRPRLPVKVGTRSMQWKREGAQMTSGDSVPSPTARNLTYVRTESKIDVNSGNA